MKEIIYWNSKVQADIDSFPEPVLERINFELTALQNDCANAFSEEEDFLDETVEFPPAKHKAMRETIGRYAKQITIKSGDSYRVIYVVKFSEGIYVLHAFKKKTNGTSKKAYTPAKTRYKDLEQYRRENKLK